MRNALRWDAVPGGYVAHGFGFTVYRITVGANGFTVTAHVEMPKQKPYAIAPARNVFTMNEAIEYAETIAQQERV